MTSRPRTSTPKRKKKNLRKTQENMSSGDESDTVCEPNSRKKSISGQKDDFASTGENKAVPKRYPTSPGKWQPPIFPPPAMNAIGQEPDSVIPLDLSKKAVIPSDTLDGQNISKDSVLLNPKSMSNPSSERQRKECVVNISGDSGTQSEGSVGNQIIPEGVKGI